MKHSQKKLLILLLLTVFLCPAYFVCQHYEIPVHYLYIAAGAVLGLGYVIYNKGFSGKGVTPEMLPDTMSPEEKQAFINDSIRRQKTSEWVLLLLIPILVTLAADMIYLFIFPTLEGLFL